MATWRGTPPPTETPRLPPPTGHIPRMPRQSGTLDREFRWPVGLALTVSIGLSAGWLVLGLLAGKSFDVAFTQSGYVFSVAFMVLIVALPLGSWGIHCYQEIRSARPERPVPRPRQSMGPPPPRVNKRGGKPRETMQEKLERAFAKAGEQMRKTGEHLMSAPPTRPRTTHGRYAQDVEPIEVEVEPTPEASLMEMLYERTHRMYHRCLTRASFETAYPGLNGQAIYAECKNWWTALGWVDEDGRGTMTWRYPEHELYQGDRGLARTAERNGFVFPGGER